MNKHRAIALCLGWAILAFAGSAHAQLGPPTGVRGIDKFNGTGPETVMRVTAGICTRFLPMSSAPAGSRPGLGWANGTGANPGSYSPNLANTNIPGGILGRVASYGTLVTAANTTQSGDGRDVRQCMEELVRDRPDSNGKFATSGHSQGGSGTLNAAIINSQTGNVLPRQTDPPNPRVVVTCPVQMDGVFTAKSLSSSLRGTATGPALIMCGGQDNLAPCTSANNGDTKFNEATVPVTRISVVNAPHTGANSPPGAGGLYPALVTACVEAALGGDREASAALQPNGAANNNGTINRIASRNFPPANQGGGLTDVAAALAVLQNVILALQALGGGS